MRELVAQTEVGEENWKASLPRAGVYPNRSSEKDEYYSTVRGARWRGGEGG